VCITKLYKVLIEEEHKLVPGKVKHIKFNTLQVQFFKIYVYHKKAPLILKIAHQDGPVNAKYIHVYFSFGNEYPDAENNDEVFNSGKIKISPPGNLERFYSVEYCSFAILTKVS
jgi:hypothetical protein